MESDGRDADLSTEGPQYLGSFSAMPRLVAGKHELAVRVESFKFRQEIFQILVQRNASPVAGFRRFRNLRPATERLRYKQLTVRVIYVVPG